MIKGGEEMKTKIIFNTLAFVMLLTAACSRENINDNNAKEGYTIPVTINVTRQGDDAATRATYNDGTKKLEFSTGDKLFVNGWNGSMDFFAGTLDYVPESGGTFSGTITTENEYTGTADELLTTAQSSGSVFARLLPNGYGTYGYFSIAGTGALAYVNPDYDNAFATTKALAVEQFSDECSDTYSGGFALSPANAILNFTIIGLPASTSVDVSLTDLNGLNISQSATTNASGTATFAVGGDVNNNLSAYTLTVAGNVIPLGYHVLTEGKIYNITRSASPLANVTDGDLGKVIGADGNIYTNADAATAASTTAVAKIVYVGSDTGEAAPYNHGLALSMSDANGGSNCAWTTSSGSTVHTYTTTSSTFASESGLQYNATHNTETYPAFKFAIANNSTAAPIGCSAWFLASGYQWEKMISAVGGYASLRDGFSSVGGTNMQKVAYRSSTEHSSYSAWIFDFFSSGSCRSDSKVDGYYVRSALAF